MKSIILLLVFFLFSVSFSQNYQITKIIETNLFELDNGEKIRLYGLDVPSTNDTNLALSQLATKILDWEQTNIPKWRLIFDSVSTNSDGTKNVIAHFSSMFEGENLAKLLLSIGYAKLSANVKQEFYSEVIAEQAIARKKKIGVWHEIIPTSAQEKIWLENIQKNKENSINLINPNDKSSFRESNIAIMCISVAMVLTGYDYIKEASEIQNSIDAVKKLNPIANVSDAESSKSRKQLVGWTCFVAGAISFGLSIDALEVKTNFRALSVRYRF